MVKMTVKIDGMACGMCESHVNDTVRQHFQIKKVSSSFKKGETEILAEEAPDEEALKKAISDTGYQVISITTEPYEKRGLFGRKK